MAPQDQPLTIPCRVCAAGQMTPYQTVAGREYWACGTCQAVVLAAAQLPRREDEEARYLKHQNDPADARYRQFLARLATPLLTRLGPAQEGLDYGCGPGPALVQMLEAAGHRMQGYDPQFRPDTAALARTYNFITCSEVVEHFHFPAQEFARLAALLRPGGWLGIMTSLLPDDARFATWPYRRDPTHVAFYRAHTFAVLATQYGWAVELPAPDVVLLRKL